MWQIKNIESGDTQDCAIRPQWVSGIWECGEFRITDANGDQYEVVEPAAEAKKVSPVEFKLLFTAGERVAIKAARASDPVIHDFYTIVEDPRLTHVDLGLQSTRDAIDYLIAQGLVDAARREAILSGVLQ